MTIDRLYGEIDSYCYMILRGKPAAVMPVKEVYVEKLISRAISAMYELKTYVQPLDEGWVQLWIYKKDYMLEVIKCLPEKPETLFDHWVLGKVFGYSDEAIEEFVKG